MSRTRRVIIKAEVVLHPGRAPKNNPRFVVTNPADAPENHAVPSGPASGEATIQPLNITIVGANCPAAT